MEFRKPEQRAAVSLKPAVPEPSAAVVRPLTHQPIVAVSLVLIAASVAQLAISLVNARFLAGGSDAGVAAPSSLIANDRTFEAFTSVLQRAAPSPATGDRIVFGVLLVVAILSSVGWYAVARLMLGPAWGLWCGAVWALHPLFAFLAQRPSALTLSLVCVPVVWALLLWWNRNRRRRVAFLAGIVAGFSVFVSMPMAPAFVIAASVLFATGRFKRRSVQSFPLIWLGFFLPLVGVWFLLGNSDASSPLGSFSTDLSRAFEDNTTFGRAIQVRIGPNSTPPLAELIGIIGAEFLRSPVAGARWFAVRIWQTLYATADGHFQRPLFAVQMVFLIPAVWGAAVCLRQRFWRWPAVACLILVASHWLAAAVAQPLARNVAPVGGVVVLFVLVAVADLYERAFGRRLEARHS